MNISSKILEPQGRSHNKGCELAPCCLDCPFPACIKEEVGGGKRWLKARRDAGISELRRVTSITIEELGMHFNVSKRTIYRALKKSQKQNSKIKMIDKNEQVF